MIWPYRSIVKAKRKKKELGPRSALNSLTELDLNLHLHEFCRVEILYSAKINVVKPVYSQNMSTQMSVIACTQLVIYGFIHVPTNLSTQSFLYYILPMTWRFTYVPILSASSLELLEAPGTFMMGCHSKHLDVVEQVSSNCQFLCYCFCFCSSLLVCCCGC